MQIFIYSELKLVIEIDWDIHYTDEAIWYDEERTIELNKLWLEVIRYTNYEVLNNIDWVSEDLKMRLDINPLSYQTSSLVKGK